MRVVLSKGKWLLFAIVMLVLPLGVAGSFGAQMATLSIQAETMSQTELASSEIIENLSPIVRGDVATRQGGSQTSSSTGDRLATTSSRSATASEQSSRNKDEVNLAEPEPTKDDTNLSTVWFDPQGAYGGSDTNDGKTSSTPVKTISKVKSIISQTGTVMMRSYYAVADGETVDFGYPTIKVTRDKDLAFTGDSYFSIGSGTVTFKNITFTYNTGTEEKPFIKGNASGFVTINESVCFDDIKTSSILIDSVCQVELFCTFSKITSTNVLIKTQGDAGKKMSKLYSVTFKNLSANSLWQAEHSQTNGWRDVTINGCKIEGVKTATWLFHMTFSNFRVSILNSTFKDISTACGITFSGKNIDVTLGSCNSFNVSSTTGLIYVGGENSVVKIQGGTYGNSSYGGNVCNGISWGGVICDLFGAGSSLTVSSTPTFSYNKNGSLFWLVGDGTSVNIQSGNFFNNENKYLSSQRKNTYAVNVADSVLGTVVGTLIKNGDGVLQRHSVTVTGGYFHDNVNYDDGGVIACGGDLTVQGTAKNPIKFENNTACNGGAIYSVDALGIAGGATTTTIQYATFTNNSAVKQSSDSRTDYQNGGAVYSWTDYTNIDNCTFERNYSKTGGVIAVMRLTLTNSIVTKNGVKLDNSGNETVSSVYQLVMGVHSGDAWKDNAFTYNHCEYGLSCRDLKLQGCTFADNTLNHNLVYATNTLETDDCVVQNNTFHESLFHLDSWNKVSFNRVKFDNNNTTPAGKSESQLVSFGNDAGANAVFKACTITSNSVGRIVCWARVTQGNVFFYGGTIKDNYFSDRLFHVLNTTSMNITLTCGLTAEGNLNTGDRLCITNNKGKYLVYATNKITYNLGYVTFAYNTTGISRVYSDSTTFTDKQINVDSAGVITVDGGNINFLAPIRLSQNRGPRGGLIAVLSGEVLLTASSVGHYIESYNVGANGKGAMFYVGGSGKLNLTGININDQFLTGVGIIYVDKGGELNLGSVEKETLIYNSHGTTGLIYVLGKANIVNTTIVQCGVVSSSYGAIYVGGSGSANIDGIKTTYETGGETKYSNYGLYGGTITCGLVYDTDGNAVAGTVSGGVVNMKGGNITGPGTAESASNPTIIKGGGVYVGDGATFNMLKSDNYGWGYITNNTTTQGGQICVDKGGIANIYGDIRYDYEKRQKVGESGAEIWYDNWGRSVMALTGGTINLLGGEIYNIELRGGSFVSNGGIVSNFSVNHGNVQISNSIITNFKTHRGSFHRFYNANISITKSYINAKNQVNSDAIFAFDFNSNTTAYFKDCVIDDCRVMSKDGETSSIFRQTSVSTLVFDGCEIKNNNYMVFYGANENASLTLQDCEMYNNTIDQVAYFRPFGNFNMINCNYHNNTGLINIEKCTTSNISGSEFRNNPICRAEALLRLYSCALTIVDSVFDGNSSHIGGTVLLRSGSNVKISDSEFTNNKAIYDSIYHDITGLGGAIKVEAGSLTLGGRVMVRGNKTVLTPDAFVSHKSGSSTLPPRERTAPTGGGIFVGTGGKLVIKQGTLLVIKENTRQILDADGVETASYTDNLYIEGSKNILMGDLDRGSEVGINCASVGDDLDAILSLGESYPVTNDLLSVFSADNTSYDLRFVSISDASGTKNGLLYYKKIRSEYWVIVNDNAVSYDPKIAQSVGSIVLMFGDNVYAGDYKVTYSVDGVNYSTDAPSYRNIGTYAVRYKVEAYKDNGSIDTTFTGTTYIRILGSRLYIQTLPKAHISYGALLRTASFYGGEVVSADGGLVAGSWSFGTELGRQVGENGKKYLAKFTPANIVNVDSVNLESLTGDVEVVISYQFIFYTNGYFATRMNDSSARITGITDLKTMVEYMEDGSTLIFCDTFNIVGNVSIDTGDKRVTFTRYIDFKSRGDTKPMIAIKGSSATIKNQLTLRGNIYIDGMAPFSGVWNFTGGESNELASNVKWYSVFEVGKSTSASETGGTLVLENGVVIRNWILKLDAENVGLITICTGGTVKLDGCEIYANRILAKDRQTSVITNNGTLTIANGIFMKNVITSGASYEGNRGQYDNVFGKGGFLFCNTGSNTTINGGEFYSNRAQYGGAIYVIDATLNLLGGKIYANRAYTNGGAVYVSATDDNSVSITIGDCEIYANMAGADAGSLVFENLKSDDGLTVFSADGRELTGVSLLARLQEIEDANMKNVDFDELDKVATDGSVGVTALIFSAFCLAFVCVVTYRINRRKVMSIRIK